MKLHCFAIGMNVRTYIYKLTSDRGGAPCAPEPLAGENPLLTLSICKPAIRRTAQPGDRLLGLTSRALVDREGYPACAVIYAARVSRVSDFGAYYAADSPFRYRPDCVYRLDPEAGLLEHTGRTRLHAEPAYAARDVGRAPLYRNARVLLCDDFRYFGTAAVPISARWPALRQIAEGLGQGHRVFAAGALENVEAGRLFTSLWRLPTRFTPARVDEEAPRHRPR